jgi:hypothetical protein
MFNVFIVFVAFFIPVIIVGSVVLYALSRDGRVRIEVVEKALAEHVIHRLKKVKTRGFFEKYTHTRHATYYLCNSTVLIGRNFVAVLSSIDLGLIRIANHPVIFTRNEVDLRKKILYGYITTPRRIEKSNYNQDIQFTFESYDAFGFRLITYLNLENLAKPAVEWIDHALTYRYSPESHSSQDIHPPSEYSSDYLP